jgi:hypothetical protein
VGNDGAKFCQTASQSRGLLEGFIVYAVCHHGFGTLQLDMLLDQYGRILTSSIVPRRAC